MIEFKAKFQAVSDAMVLAAAQFQTASTFCCPGTETPHQVKRRTLLQF